MRLKTLSEGYRLQDKLYRLKGQWNYCSLTKFR